jgi:hypothetical protein
VKWLSAVVIFLALLWLPERPVRAAGAPPPPTMDEIKTRFEANDFNGVLRDLAHVLSLHGKAAEPYDRYDLLMLRGETELRLKQAAPAAMAFKQAASQTKDPQQTAVASSTDMLVRRSNQFQYTPKKAEKGKVPEPIDIVNADKRKLALAALYEDERDAAADALAQGKKATSLPQIAAAVNAISSHNLVPLDRAVHGNTEDVQKATGDLKTRTRDLIARALDQMAKQTQEISNKADEIVRIPSMRAGQPDTTHRRGLQGTDRQELSTISQGCRDIAQAAHDLMGTLSDNPDEANDLIEQANGIRQKAEKALRAT